jgi:hypothetical protein
VKVDTWYSYALANKLYGQEISDAPGPADHANFNSNLGNVGCLDRHLVLPRAWTATTAPISTS